MSASVQYRIGTEVSCSDRSCGHVSRVVLDPVARAITHVQLALSKADVRDLPEVDVDKDPGSAGD